jgi:hypothetical protein
VLGTQSASPLFTLPKAYALPHGFDAEAVDEAFEKALANGEVAQGLGYVLGRTRKGAVEAAGAAAGERGEVVREVVERGYKRAKVILGRAV